MTRNPSEDFETLVGALIHELVTLLALGLFLAAAFVWLAICRVHESLRQTPATALGLADRPWSLGDLIDAALAVASPDPVQTAPERRRGFRVIQGGVS